ncbi:ty3-gypsy retrotransposon protein [Cucumis melo var. makuwa]|uniref:Ty3-gypsy retrotransposon protein n=1 Tax=Cucumis melo var. makuwa TaxID=1194695 RepID=A0A5D3BYK5_CUCMM|nr:ty3-gypsy retrotransposon protein [Cucumis melo var. makuwa]TYK04771.1 ty3-gypsy retrotransposon protein [Cucumis melo var. makuwa]
MKMVFFDGSLLSMVLPVTTTEICNAPKFRGDARVQEFYGKRSGSQLSSAWVDSFGRGLKQEFSYILDRHKSPDVLCIVIMLMGCAVNWNSNVNGL